MFYNNLQPLFPQNTSVKRKQISLNIIKNSFKEKYNKDIIVKVGLNEGNDEKGLKIEELFKQKDVNYTSID